MTVKVHERGNAKLLTYVMTRKTPGKPEAGPKEPGLEEAGFPPWEIENWKKKGRKNPQPTGDQGSKQFEAGGEVKELLPGALLMPGDTGPWILKGYPAKGVKAGQFVLCKTVRTPERFTYKTPDGKESKLWVYSFVDWMSYPN